MPSDLNILVVDDDKLLLELLQDTLGAIGYQAEGVDSAYDALERVAKGSYDLIISDIHMPGMDGLELLKKIRISHPDLPLLFVSGDKDVEVIGEAIPDGFLTKPFRINMLEELIESTLSNRSEATSRFKRILVVDDDPIFRDMVVEVLKYYSYEITEAVSGEAAVQILKKNSFDVVVTDFHMGEMDGLQLAAHIKEKYKNLPVILVTAYLDKKSVKEALSVVQIDAFLKKPFPINSIIELLKQL